MRRCLLPLCVAALTAMLCVCEGGRRVPRQAFGGFPAFPGPRAQGGQRQQHRQQQPFRQAAAVPVGGGGGGGFLGGAGGGFQVVPVAKGRPGGQAFDVGAFALAGYEEEEEDDGGAGSPGAQFVTPSPQPPALQRVAGGRKLRPRPVQALQPEAQADYHLPGVVRVPASVQQRPKQAILNARGNSLSKGTAFKNVQQLEEEELEEEQPDRLTELLQDSDFTCVSKKDGYYADEKLSCEVFHYCQDSAKHSWICPNGFTFHQVHLICMPPSSDNICKKSSEFHFVNDFLYRPVEVDERNGTLKYADRYYPDDYIPGLPFEGNVQGAAAPSPAAPSRVYSQQAYRDDVPVVVRARPASRVAQPAYRSQQANFRAQAQPQRPQPQSQEEEYDDAYFQG